MEEKEYRFRDLRSDEIDVRVAICSEKGVSLLLYKDARVDMDILDEEVGPDNWQRDHKELKGNIYCGVSIWDEKKQQWITKWDAGAESFTEKEKGEASDSFKRACFNIGIGRELYTAPFIWIPAQSVNLIKKEENGRTKYTTNDKFRVEAIEITDKEITGLAIKNQNNIRVFLYKKGHANGLNTTNE